MTMEQVLGKIKDEHGKSALRDGQSLLGLFVDYSHNQLRPQANALRTFLDCKGNQRILNLCSEQSQKQQTEYHRLIQEMVRDYNMQEATAADVCASFWRVAIGTEPPVSLPVPEPKPVRISAQVVDATAATAQEHTGATSDNAVAPRPKQTPTEQNSGHDGNQKQITQKSTIPIFKKTPIRSPLQVWSDRFMLVWIAISILAAFLLVPSLDSPGAGVEIFLVTILIVAEIYFSLFGLEKIKESGKVSPYIVPGLEAGLFPFAIARVRYEQYFMHDEVFAGLVAIVLALWAILTIVSQILRIKALYEDSSSSQ